MGSDDPADRVGVVLRALIADDDLADSPPPSAQAAVDLEARLALMIQKKRALLTKSNPERREPSLPVDFTLRDPFEWWEITSGSSSTHRHGE